MNKIPVPIVTSELPQRDVDALLEQLAELRTAANPWTPIVASLKRKRAQRRR